MRNFDFVYFIETFPVILSKLGTTLVISLGSLIIGIVLAILLAVGKQSKIKVIKGVSTVYISFFRATPLLVQIFFIYYGISTFIPIFQDLSAFNAIIISLGLHSSAYMAETIRGAISSVDKGQYEAGLAIGMSKGQIFRRIVFPQALRVAVPGLSNSFVDLIKGSSLAFTIGVMELMSVTQMEGATTYRYFECYAIVMIIYWVVVIIYEQFQKRIEYSLSKAY